MDTHIISSKVLDLIDKEVKDLLLSKDEYISALENMVHNSNAENNVLKEEIHDLKNNGTYSYNLFKYYKNKFNDKSTHFTEKYKMVFDLMYMIYGIKPIDGFDFEINYEPIFTKALMLAFNDNKDELSELLIELSYDESLIYLHKQSTILGRYWDLTTI